MADSLTPKMKGQRMSLIDKTEMQNALTAHG